MKVLYVITGLQRAAGTTTFVENVVKRLRSIGHFAEIVTTAGAFQDCDIVHIHGLWSGLLHKASQFARKNRIPVVWSTHGMTAPWSLRHKRWKKWLAWNLYQRRDLRRAAAIHCTSDQEVVWNATLGFMSCFVVPLGTREMSHAETPSAQRREGVLLFVGRIYPVKGLVNLIRAWKLIVSDDLPSFAKTSADRPTSSPQCDPVNPVNHVKKTQPPSNCHLPLLPWRLRIVGPDQAGHLAELKAEVGRLHLENSIEFPGPKFGADLRREYESCDMLVLPSFTENFGVTVIDALAHGKPVIASTATPWRELRERGCGWWVDNSPEALSAALREAMSLSDPERREMGARGRALVEEKYTWNAVVKTMIEGYEGVLRKSENWLNVDNHNEI